jgi:hypothetical protein
MFPDSPEWSIRGIQQSVISHFQLNKLLYLVGYKMAREQRCKYCWRVIFMAYVLPPGECRRRYVPFDDLELTSCHLNICEGSATNYELYCNDCIRFIPATRKEWVLKECPNCGSDDVL